MIYTLIAGVALIVILAVLGEVAAKHEGKARRQRLAELERCIAELESNAALISPAPRPPRES